MKRISFLAVVLALGLAACRDIPTRPGSGTADIPADLLRPLPSVVDADNGGGNAHFFWLRPIGDRRSFPGQADGTLSPRVEICQRNAVGDDCEVGVPPLASYTPTSGNGNDRVRVDGQDHYFVNWHMETYAPERDGVYRIRVLLQGRELGHADVIALRQPEIRAYSAPAGDEIIPVSDRGVFRIAFRIEVGALAQEFCTDPGACETEVEIAGDGEGTTVQVQDPTGGDQETAGSVSVPDAAFVDSNGDPVEEVVVTAEVSPTPPSQDVFQDDDAEIPYFVAINTFPEDVQVDPGSNGVLVEVCQDENVLSSRGIGPGLHSQLILYKVSKPKPGFPNGETKRLPTSFNATACQPAPVPGAPAGVLGMLRSGASRFADLFTPQPLVAASVRLHGGLNTIIRGGSSTEPAFSTFGATLGPNAGQTTATVPPGVVGVTTTIDIQVRTALGADFHFGGDSIHVVVTGGPNAGAPVTLTDDGDGTYTAQYTPTATGIDEISISLTTFDGVAQGPIGGSPYASAVSATGNVTLQPFTGFQSGLLGTTLTDSVVVRVVDNTTGPLAGASVTFTQHAPDGSVISVQSVMTDVDGFARVLWTLGSEPGRETMVMTSLGSLVQIQSVAVLPTFSVAGSFVTVTGPSVIGVGDVVDVTFHAADASSAPVAQPGLPIEFFYDPPSEALGSTGLFGPVTDNDDGTYTTTFTGQTSGAPVEVKARVVVPPEAIGTTPPTITVDDDLSEAEANDLLGVLYANWHAAMHHFNTPAAMLSAAADAHGSSWRNWGMWDMNMSPRVAWNNDPSYDNSVVTQRHWRTLYLALAAARDVLMALDDGLDIGPGGADNDRARAYASFVQGLSLGALALTYDQAFVLDENTDLNTVGLESYSDVMDAAIAKLDAAIAFASAGAFTLPAGWVGPNTVSNTLLIQLAHTHKARFLAYVARTPAGRAGADWAQIVVETALGITSDFSVEYDGFNEPWWDNAKLYTSGIFNLWAKADYLWVGAADASGAYQTWLATPDATKSPFDIVTADRRVTGAGGPQTDGLYICYDDVQAFQAGRGLEHFSNYRDCRFSALLTGPGSFGGTYTMLKVEELNLLRAEAAWRMSDYSTAAAVVNQTRITNGQLPAVTIAGTSGGSCVPRTQAGACGDLFEALKWEKRMEAFHYSYGTEFFDDRGWGDLVTGTANQLPVPGAELERLGIPNYTFGGVAPGLIAGGASTRAESPEGVGYKLLDRWLGQSASERVRLLREVLGGGTAGPVQN